MSNPNLGEKLHQITVLSQLWIRSTQNKNDNKENYLLFVTGL